jgi:DNA-binding transcriptional LysR family regulator
MRGAGAGRPILAADLPAIESLRCFLAAARLSSFRKAAREIALTPAALGARIKQLEAQLGARLFARTTRRVTLTEAGLALVPRAEACLAAAHECVRAARGDAPAAVVELTLGTRHELGLSWILPQLPDLERAIPGLRLGLYFGSGPDLLVRVRTAEIDCAVTSTRASDPRLDGLPLHREDYVFVGQRALLAARPLRRPEDAARHVLLDAAPDLPLFRYFRDASPAGERFAFARVVHLGTIEAIHRRVAAGTGVAVLPRYLVARDLARRTLVPVLPRVRLLPDAFRLVFRSGDPRRSVLERLAAEMARVPLR